MRGLNANAVENDSHIDEQGDVSFFRMEGMISLPSNFEVSHF